MINTQYSPIQPMKKAPKKSSTTVNNQFNPFLDTSEMLGEMGRGDPIYDIKIQGGNNAPDPLGNLGTQGGGGYNPSGGGDGSGVFQPPDLGLDPNATSDFNLDDVPSPTGGGGSQPSIGSGYGVGQVTPSTPMTPAGMNRIERLGHTSTPMTPAGMNSIDAPITSYDSGIDMSKLRSIKMNTSKGKGDIRLGHYGGKRAIVYPDGTVKVGGHRNWRTNSPFNIVYTPATLKRYKKYGAIGADHAGDGVEKGWRGLVFKTPEGGARAWVDLIHSHYGSHNALTIGKKFQIGMTPQAYSRAIQRGLPKNFDLSKKFRNYSSHELDLFAKAQMKVEGFKKGKMFKL